MKRLLISLVLLAVWSSALAFDKLLPFRSRFLFQG